MLFNSIDFAIFLPLVFIVYWFLTNLKLQNLFIVVSSYVFYGWWDWRFLSLILFSTIVDYSIGLALAKEEKQTKRKLLLWTSLLVNLGFLGFFKYYNFFLDNFISAFSFFGTEIKPNSLYIILPVGISFYTFQTLSYTVDVYRNKMAPTKDFIAFSAFVSFFPQLVAGPIEKATHLLPQFYIKRYFDKDKAVDGLRQILWGLFKKIVIADTCAKYVNLIFENPIDFSGSTLALGAIFFAFQIYCDFSGYSDIAIGTSRLFGFNLKQNFAFPYFSRDIAEFWRRWHISLSTWFRDYLYIPLGGSRGAVWIKVRNTLIIFLVSGFWHGANWTFIVWGALNALYFLPLLLSKNNRNNLDSVAQDKILPSFKELFSMLGTFGLTLIAWVFFRAENIEQAFIYLRAMFSKTLIQVSVNDLKALSVGADIIYLVVLILFLIIFEWLQRSKQHALHFNHRKQYWLLRWLLYYCLIALMFYYNIDGQEFIYFQF